MSLSTASKMTDSQSNKIHGIQARHRLAVTTLMLTLSSLVPDKAGARSPRGECPWGEPVVPDGARRVFTFEGIVPATPEQIFPLLCPVLEYEWLDDWTCSMKYSESGAAEEGCAFSTRIQIGENWICSRYEPPRAIQYVVWLRLGWMVLDATLAEQEDGTTLLHWTRTFTATQPLGRKMIGKMKAEQIEGQMKAINEQLIAYLQDG